MLAVDDGRRDVGRQPRKPQESVEVGRRDALEAGDVMDGQLASDVKKNLNCCCGRRRKTAKAK